MELPRKSFLGTKVLGVASLLVFSTSVSAFSIDGEGFGEIAFDPTDVGGGIGTFSFVPAAGSNFEVVGSTVPLFELQQGLMTGEFVINPPITPDGSGERASVSGAGTFTILDEFSNQFSATLTFDEIGTFPFFANDVGGLGGIANLTNISYSGSNTELAAIRSAGAGTVTLSFQGVGDLTNITTNATSPTSFSGDVLPAAVPLPEAAWLFGSALVGTAIVGRRHKKRGKKQPALAAT